MANVSVSQMKARSVAQINRERQLIKEEKQRKQDFIDKNKQIEERNKQIEEENKADDIKYQEALQTKPVFEEKIGGSSEYVNKLNDWLTKYSSVLGKGDERYKETTSFIEQQKSSLKNKTYTGKDVQQLAKQTDKYDVTYYSDGSIKSIKEKPKTYETYKQTGKSTKGKPINAQVRTGSYIPYEIEFRPDGTLKSEIIRKDDVIETRSNESRRTSWERNKVEKTVFDDLTVQYDAQGKPIKVIDKEKELFASKSDDGKDYKKYTIKDREIKDFQKGESIYTPVSKVREGLFQYQKEALKKSVIEPVTTKKFTVTASNLFGTSNNVLRSGEVEIVNKLSRTEVLKQSGLTPSEIKDLEKNNPKVLAKVIDDTKSRLKGEPTQAQKRFLEVKEQQYGESIRQELSSKGSVVFSSDGKSLIAEGQTTQRKKVEEQIGNLNFIGAGTTKEGEIVYDYNFKREKLNPISETIREGRISFQYKSFEGDGYFTKRNARFLNAPFISEAGAIIFGVLEGGDKLVRGTYNVGKYVVQNRKQTGINILNAELAIDQAKYKVNDYFRGAVKDPKGTYKKTAPVVVAGGIIALGLGSKAITYTKENPRQAFINTATFIAEAYVYGKAIEGVGKLIKASKNTITTIKASRKLKGKIIVYDDIGRQVDITRLKVRPIEFVSSKTAGVVSKQGNIVSSTEISFNLGKQQLINPKNLPKGNAIVIEGKKITGVLSESGISTVSTSNAVSPYGTSKKLIGKVDDVKGIASSKGFNRALSNEALSIDTTSGLRVSTLTKEPNRIVLNINYADDTGYTLDRAIKFGQVGKAKITLTDAKNIFSSREIVPTSGAGFYDDIVKTISLKPKQVGNVPKNLLTGKQTEIYRFNQPVKGVAARVYVYEGLDSPTLVAEFVKTATAPSKTIFGELAKGNTVKLADGITIQAKGVYKTFKDVIKNQKEEGIISSDGRTATILEQPKTEQTSVSKSKTEQKSKSKSKTEQESRTGYTYTQQEQIIKPVFVSDTTSSQFFSERVKQVRVTSPILVPTIKTGTATTTSSYLGSKIDYKTDAKIESIIDTKEATISDVAYSTKSAIDSKIDTKTAVDSIFKPKTTSKSLSKISSYFDSIRQLKEPIPEEPKPVFPKFKIGFGNNIGKSLFEVEVRRKGEFKSVKPRGFRSIREAFASGIKETKESAAASFRIKEKRTGRVLTNLGINLGREFRPSKREAGVIVQKRSFRIGTAGEKQEITKKGLFALKIKKNKNIFGGF